MPYISEVRMYLLRFEYLPALTKVCGASQSEYLIAFANS